MKFRVIKQFFDIDFLDGFDIQDFQFFDIDFVDGFDIQNIIVFCIYNS